jgi:hypothetical protein
MSQNTLAIQQLYVAYFNRPADPSGLAYWETVVAANNGDTTAVSASFSQSGEYKAAYAGLSNDKVVNQVYNNLFGHDADPAGLAYWSNLLSAGSISVSNVVTQIAGGALTTDKEALTDKVAVAAAFTTALDTTAERLAYDGAAANATASSFLSTVTNDATMATALANIDATIATLSNAGIPHELTTGIDTLVGGSGNDNFVAGDVNGVSSWSVLDSINGGGGTNSFTVASNNSINGAPAGSTLTNIQTVTLTTANDIDGDFSTLTGVTTLNLVAGDDIEVTAALTTDVNALKGTTFVEVTGGKNVTVVNTSNNETRVFGSAGDVKVTGGAQTVYVGDGGGDSAIGGAITVASKGNVFAGGGTSLTTTFTGAVDFATRTTHLAAQAAALKASTAANTLASNDAAIVANLGTLATTLSADVTAVNATQFLADTKAAFEAGTITQAQKVTIDTAYLSASTTTAGAQAAAVTAALTTIQTAAAATAAADNVAATTAAAAYNAAQTVVSNDSVASTIITDTANTKLATVSVTGNYGSGSSTIIHDGSTLGNTLTTVSVTNGSSNVALGGNALANVSLSSGTYSNVTIANNTIGNTLNLNLTDATATVFGASTFDGSTFGGVSKTTTLNLDAEGKDALQLNGFNTVASVVVTGAGDVTLGGTFAANAAFDTTGLTGAFTGSIGSAQTFVGGDGVNTISTSSTVQAAGATVAAGAGTSDTLVLNTAADAATAKALLFSGFEVLEVASGLGSVDVSKFTNSAITSLVIDGSATVTGLNATQAAAVTIDASGSVGTVSLGITGATTVGQIDTVTLTADNGLPNGSVQIADLIVAGVETLNLNTVTELDINSLAGNSALTAINASGDGYFHLNFNPDTVNVNTSIDTHLVTAGSDIEIGVSTTTALKLVGSDVGNSIINAFSANGNNVISAGDGNNQITAGFGVNTITVGDGDNTISAGAGGNTIVAGNGYNTITTTAGVDHITVGTGGNTIDSGAGADVITLGAHVLGTVDTIILSAAAVAAVSTDVNGSQMHTINGFVSGADHLDISASFLLTPATFDNSVPPVQTAPAVTAAGGTLATLTTAVSDATSVATTAAVYALLAGTDTSTLAASTATVGGIHAMEVTFTTGAAAGTYLVINDGTAGFQAGHDIVVKLVGNTAITAHDIVIA